MTKLRLPTETELFRYYWIVIKFNPEVTQLGAQRQVAKFFHCSLKDVRAIMYAADVQGVKCPDAIQALKNSYNVK